MQCELRRVPSAVSEPALGEIRLQWWREAFDDMRSGKPPRAHPVVEELAAAGLGEPRFAARIEGVVDAYARPLYGEGFADIDDLVSWLEKTDGDIDALALTLLGAAPESLDAAMRAGAAFALAREGRALAPALADEIGPRALSVAGETGAALKQTGARAAPAVLHLALTRAYARRNGEAFAVRKRLRLFAAMAFGWF